MIPSIQLKDKQSVISKLQKFPEKTQISVERLLQDYLEGVLLEKVRENTPIKTGALRRSLRVRRVPSQKHVVKFSIESDLPYALRIHEEEYRNVQKAEPTPEGGVGNKYIERVVFYHIPELKEALKPLPQSIATE